MRGKQSYYVDYSILSTWLYERCSNGMHKCTYFLRTHNQFERNITISKIPNFTAFFHILNVPGLLLPGGLCLMQFPIPRPLFP